MSLIRAIKQVLGLSVNPANNFVWDAGDEDGTLWLSRGNPGALIQDIMTVDAAGKVAFPQNAQTWQDVKASRALLTNYTNNTGQDIEVSASISSTALNTIRLTVDGVALFGNTIAVGGFSSINATVPAGAVYQVSAAAPGTQTLQHWKELR